MRGIKVRELLLRKIEMPSGGERLAYFVGPDAKTYALSVGTRVYAGFLKSIESDKVRFTYRSGDPGAPQQEQDVEIAIPKESPQ